MLACWAKEHRFLRCVTSLRAADFIQLRNCAGLITNDVASVELTNIISELVTGETELITGFIVEVTAQTALSVLVEGRQFYIDADSIEIDADSSFWKLKFDILPIFSTRATMLVMDDRLEFLRAKLLSIELDLDGIIAFTLWSQVENVVWGHNFHLFKLGLLVHFL